MRIEPATNHSQRHNNIITTTTTTRLQKTIMVMVMAIVMGTLSACSYYVECLLFIQQH